MQQLSAEELKNRIKANNSLTLIDIREDWERAEYNIGGMHIPMGEVMLQLDMIPREGDVVLYCEKGIRSAITIQRLEAAGYNNLINLSGGMKAWKAAL